MNFRQTVSVALLALACFGCANRPAVVETHPTPQPLAASTICSRGCENRLNTEIDGEGPEESAISPGDFLMPLRPLRRDVEITLGPDDAIFTAIVFLDVSCPYSRDAWNSLKKIAAKPGASLRLVVRHFPIKSGSDSAAAYLEAARRIDSGKSIELLDAMFLNPPGGMAALFGSGPDGTLKENIAAARLSKEKLDQRVDDDLLAHVVALDVEEAHRLGFTGTPGIVINGIRIRGAVPPETFEALLVKLSANQSRSKK